MIKIRNVEVARSAKKVVEYCDVWLDGYPDDASSITDLDVQGVIGAFKDNGINVTREAVEHNFNAWKADMKSGYRDDGNGYFLFTPCGCNKLSFQAEPLGGKDYQKTYTC